jgi:hypothetical protein
MGRIMALGKRRFRRIVKIKKKEEARRKKEEERRKKEEKFSYLGEKEEGRNLAKKPEVRNF